MNKCGKVILSCLLICIISSSCGRSDAADKGAEGKEGNVFEIVNPDYDVSPYTGMTREHWKQAARYLLEGAFSYIRDPDDPMKFPKQPGKSYPQDLNNTDRVRTEKLEGLCRTLFLAAPLLKENPDLTLNGTRVADYYRHQICRLTDPGSPSFIHPRPQNGGPSQNLVEFGALAISLFVAPEVIWDPLPDAEKEKLAATMLSYGDGPTVPSNWRFFNIFVLSFFKEYGYEVNEALLVEYLQKSLDQYRGQGWYNDSPAYDYYSMWAFQLYGLLWSEFFGDRYYPEIAGQFRSHFVDLKGNYPYLFGRNGKMIMWGRSISYRIGSIVPFPLLGLTGGQGINFGWMRRIASGTMLQFLQNPEFLKDRVPTLGFYGAFEPAVQIYSCRGSVYWMGKAFLGLLVPADNPFWTAKENDGPWEDTFEKDKVYNKFQPATNILITDYPSIGASEVRAWCHEQVADDWQKFRSTENYNRLSYNSAFPWQADGKNGEVAMNYVVKNSKSEWEAFRLYTFKKFEESIYYRDVVLETDEDIKMNLAEMPLPNGILRVDRNLSNKPVEMRLGHYALPEKKVPIVRKKRQVREYEVNIIDNGEYQLAMVPITGWEGTEIVNAEGLHPESKNSTVLNVTGKYIPGKSRIFATLMLWKKSGEKWSDKELMPVKKMIIAEGDSGVKIEMSNGDEVDVAF